MSCIAIAVSCAAHKTVPARLGTSNQAELGCTQQQPPGAHCPTGMILVPAGTPVLSMGKEPRSIQAFCIDRVEVTLGEYRRCIVEGWCRPPHASPYPYAGTLRFRTCDGVLEKEDATRDNHPAHCVDYEDATTFCQAQHKRLPIEDEWEYAARGCDRRPYPWGQELPTDARAVVETDDTSPVGTHPLGASPFGVLDMFGNVSEWAVLDPPDYHPEQHPLFPGVTYTSVIKGGDYTRPPSPEVTRLHNDLEYNTGVVPRTLSVAYVGFRCASDIAGRRSER
jgi:formylglycine-generating enzyme required for sulfatase activity